MKTTLSIVIIAIAALSFFHRKAQAQSVNWENISKENRHLLHANMGAEYGMVYGLGYHYTLATGTLPMLVGVDLSSAFGETFLDDNKALIGTHIGVFNVNHIQVATKIQGVFRSYQNQSVALLNFGCDLAATLGYYRKKWFAAAEVGFDKAIVTHFRHSDWYRNNIYSNVQNGWYQPATGGNFYYGLNFGVSVKTIDITLRVGKIIEEDFDTEPILPFYGSVGANVNF
ncbi:MAG: hypothetical protein ACK5JD_14650 [Mangrovibacterium sp.]